MSSKYLVIVAVSALMFYSYKDCFARYTSFKITGKSTVVDIDDIVKKNKDGYSEADIRRVCAEITDRYHGKGYTAFYIRKAELNRNGIVELFFNESVVEEISVTGAGARSEEIASSVYKKGNIFNEFILRENISGVKKKYNLKYLNVSVNRTADDQVLLKINVLSRSGEINFNVTTSPIYGAIPSIGYIYSYDMLYAGLVLSSSFAQKDTSLTGGALFLKKEMHPDKSYFIFLSDYNRSEDIFDKNGNLIYKRCTLAPGAGISGIQGPLTLELLITGSYDSLENYPVTKGGTSFFGIRTRIIYDNSKLKIDYEDLTYAGVNFFSGWNFIDKIPVCRINGEYIVNIPVSFFFFLSFNGNVFYTTDDDRFLQFYVFDRYLPCRNNDYSVSRWKNTAGVDFDFEALKRILYIGPCIKWGLYYSDDTIYNVYAQGIRGLFVSEKVKIELSYLFDTHNKPCDGFFFVTATGYL